MELESQADTIDTRLGSGSKHDEASKHDGTSSGEKASKHDGTSSGEAKGVVATVAGGHLSVFKTVSDSDNRKPKGHIGIA